MHPIDFLWGVLSVAGAAVPVYRLYDNRHRPGAPFLLSLVIVCALYPWAYIVYAYTPFDQGLVFAFTSWIGPFYFLGVFSYLNVQPRAWSWIRNGVLLFGAAMSVMAISNPLHGRFATFAQVTPDEPLTTTGQVSHGIGLTTMGGFAIACIIASVVLIGFYYQRSRFRFSHLVAMTLFPVAAGCAYLLQTEIKQIVSASVNTFILCTTAGLGVLTYSLLRGRFLELRPIAREQILNLVPDAVAVVDDNGVVIDCNLRFGELLGTSLGDAIGVTLAGRLPQEAWRLGSERTATRAMQLTVCGDARCFETHLVRLDDRSARGDALVLFRDVTEATLAHRKLEASQAELKALNSELARLSSTDALTGLRNRRYFLEQLSQECERAARRLHSFALLSIDLDNFKSINDSYGHAAGDEALICAARAMEAQCRAADTLARVGGEEFMVLALDADCSELEAVAHRFRQAVEHTGVVLKNGERLGLTASIGVVVVTPDQTMQSALRKADEALYAAKRAGRNRVVLGPGDLIGQTTVTLRSEIADT